MLSKKITSTCGIFLFILLLATLVNAIDFAETVTPDVTVIGSAKGITGNISLISDNKYSTFYGLGESQHHGGSINITLTYNFQEPVDFPSLNYTREMSTGGSSSDTERQIEKVSITNSSGTFVVYERNTVYGGNSGTASGGALANKTIQGSFKQVTKIEFNLYAASSGGSSDRLTRIRIYEIGLEGTIDHDKDDDGVNDTEDCNDNNPNVWKSLQGYVDNDLDGYGTGSLITLCTNGTIPTGYTNISGDCNDNNAQVHPNAREICDGVDNDCNSLTLDGSGEQAPANPIQYGVCLNSRKSCTSGAWTDTYFNLPHYQAVETICDLYDNDCDGIVDEECGIATVNLYIDGGYLPNVIYNNTQATIRFKEHYVNGSGDIEVPVKILLNGIVVYGIPSLPFSAGEKDWGIGFGVMESGNYNLTIIIDPTNVIAETNESDNVFQFSFTVNPSNCSDITPPSSISNLKLDSKSKSTLYWTWTNPTDSDFAYSRIYLNGVNVMNTSSSSYQATNLDSDTYYTITVHTADFNGNINDTDVSNTGKTDKKPFILIWDSDDTEKAVQQVVVPQNTTKKIIHGSYEDNNTISLAVNNSKPKSNNSWMWLLALILLLLIILAILLIISAVRRN